MTADEAQADLLKAHGYRYVRRIDGVWYGISPMLFTWGLFCDLDGNSYSHRYCYATMLEALSALTEWDGVGDAPGPWIVRKGLGQDVRNPSR